MGHGCFKYKSMPSKKPPTDATPKAGRLIDRILDTLDLEQLTSTIADKLGQKLLASVNTDNLVDALFDKYQEDFKGTLTRAILEKL